MTPDERIHPLVLQAIRRYIGYGWGNALIQSLIRYRFSVRMSSRCLRTLRRENACTAHCAEHCPWKDYVM